MYAIYFHDGAGGRAFIAAVDEKHSAMSMAKLLSRQDPRDVVVVENRMIGDTVLVAVFRRGVPEAAHQDADPSPEPPGAAKDAPALNT